jgi:hypothetical protein
MMIRGVKSGQLGGTLTLKIPQMKQSLPFFISFIISISIFYKAIHHRKKTFPPLPLKTGPFPFTLGQSKAYGTPH